MNESSKLHAGLRTTPWIKEIVAECLTLDPSEIDVGVPLGAMGWTRWLPFRSQA